MDDNRPNWCNILTLALLSFWAGMQLMEILFWYKR